MAKLALVVLLDQFADFEVGHLLPLLNMNISDGEEAAWSSKIVSLTKDPIESMGKLKVVPDLSIEDAERLFFDALILIGGKGWRSPEAEAVISLINKAREKQVPLAAISAAANFLAWHGFLNDVRHTGNAGGEMASHPASEYKNKKGFDETARAISDQGVITADGASPVDFTAEVLRTLHALPPSVIDKWEDVQLVGEKAFYRE